MSETELVARATQGDSEAFAELVDRYRGVVYRAALAGTGSPADAEDVAQEAFLAAYQQLGRFRGDASFKTWLLTIAWHRAINRRRYLRRWWRRVQTNGNGYVPTFAGHAETPQWSPEQALAANRLRRTIHDEIRSLSPKLRDALVLAASGEYTYEELGTMLGAPVGTVKWRVSEARRVVRQRLRDRGFGDAG